MEYIVQITGSQTKLNAPLKETIITKPRTIIFTYKI